MPLCQTRRVIEILWYLGVGWVYQITLGVKEKRNESRKHDNCRESEKSQNHHVSRKKTTTTFQIFGLVPDCPKRRKPTIIQHSEKAKKLNVINTYEVVPRIEESKHNLHLRLPCAIQLTTRIEKPKTRTINSWPGVWLKLATSRMSEYMHHFLKTFFSC